MPNVANDLSQKLYATMEKHKEVRSFHVSRDLAIRMPVFYLSYAPYISKTINVLQMLANNTISNVFSDAFSAIDVIQCCFTSLMN